MGAKLALVIEDDKQIAPLFASSLEKAGFETEVITDSYDALVRLAMLEPDLLILDLNLPNVSGLDILAYIQDQERLAKTRVIIATGEPHLIENFVGDRADLVLVKPVDVVQLRELAVRLTSDE